MAHVIKFKRSIVIGRKPTLADLQLGEMAQNTADGILYMRKGTGLSTDLIVPVSVEKGGVSWQNNIEYVIGDTVTDDNKLWICNLDHTSTLSGIASQPTNPISTVWFLISDANSNNIDVSGWTSPVSAALDSETMDGINPVSPSNPVDTGIYKTVQEILEATDTFLTDPGTI